jgi:hypothetical protein
MIKRSGALVLTLLYLVTTIGFALNKGFCGSILTSPMINTPVKSCNMHSTGKIKCCSKKHFDIKVKDAHQGQTQSFRLKTFSFEPPKPTYDNFSANLRQALSKKYLSQVTIASTTSSGRVYNVAK